MTENNRKQQNTSVSERDYDETSRASLGNESEVAYSQGGNYSDETDLQNTGGRQRRYRQSENYGSIGSSNPDSYSPGNKNIPGRNYNPGINREWREWDDPNLDPNSNFGIQGSSYQGRHNRRDYSRGQQWNSGYGGSPYSSRYDEEQFNSGRGYEENDPQWGGRYGQTTDWQRGTGRYPQYGNPDYAQRTPQYGNTGGSQYNSATYGQLGSPNGPSAYGQGRSQYENSNPGQSNLPSGTQMGSNPGRGSQYSGTNYEQGTSPYSNSYGQGGSQYDTWHKGKGPKGYRRSDERIKEDVSDRLTEDTQLDASDIEVAVTNGEVKLTGTVESREAKRRAEDLTEMISGISNVENSLRVKQDKSTLSNKDASMGAASSSHSSSSNGHDSKNKRASAMS